VGQTRDESHSLDTKHGEQVKLLTLNMFMRPPPVHTNESDYKDARLEDFARLFLQNYDVIAF